jgi:hypothetical protein
MVTSRALERPMIARFVWTAVGNRVHITDDGTNTRCGRMASEEADADDVAWYWPPCQRCYPDESWE